MTENQTPPVTIASRDHRRGLVIGGAVLVAMGAGLLTLRIRLGAFAAPTEGTQNVASRLGSAAELLADPIAFVGLGIGSILARRWARALVLCDCGLKFVFSVIGLPGVLLAGNQPGPLSAAAVLAGSLGAIGAFIGLLWFYSQPGVTRTFEACDPVERWTDRVPMLVLACSVQLVTMAVFHLNSIVVSAPSQVFGLWIDPEVMSMVRLIVLLFTLFAARAVYRFDRLTWSIFAVGYLVVSAVSVVGLIRVRLAGNSDPDLSLMIWNAGAYAMVTLAVIVGARFFFGPRVATVPPGGQIRSAAA